MPAKDKYHEAVVNTLRKAGWTTIDEQVMIILEERRLWIDLLYMAVPEAAYHGILSEAVGQQSLQQNAVELLVFDPVAEEIVAWID